MIEPSTVIINNDKKQSGREQQYEEIYYMVIGVLGKNMAPPSRRPHSNPIITHLEYEPITPDSGLFGKSLPIKVLNICMNPM